MNYIASTNALYRAAFQFRVSQSDLDPAAFVRTALRLGRAKIFGRTTVRGTEVIRIQFSAWYRTPAARRLEPIAIYYVDANTYRPVRVVSPPPYGRIAMSPDGQAVRSAAWPSFLKTGVTYPEHAGLGFPMDPSAFLAGFPGTSTRSFPVIPQYTTVSAPRAHLVYDFDNYELLAPTAANRRLTSVRAVRDGIAAYAAGFRAASTPLFSAFNAYYGPRSARRFRRSSASSPATHRRRARCRRPRRISTGSSARFTASSTDSRSSQLWSRRTTS
jgi:hypothetical protein